MMGPPRVIKVLMGVVPHCARARTVWVSCLPSLFKIPSACSSPPAECAARRDALADTTARKACAHIARGAGSRLLGCGPHSHTHSVVSPG